MIKVDSFKIKPQKNINVISEFCGRYNIAKKYIKSFKICKKSVDARKKDNIYYLFSFIVELNGSLEKKLVSSNKNISFCKEHLIYNNISNYKYNESKIFIIGEGPAGLFCAYLLALAGLKPQIIERGKDVDKRYKDVLNLWDNLKLNTNSNVQFGEGGAGTFSDGKLNTGVKDKEGRNDYVLNTFVKFGAPDCITYDAKPHIGSDILRQVVKNMRNEIIKLGGNVYFETQFIDFKEKDNKVESITLYDLKTNKTYEQKCDYLVLALGHSARDTFQMLYNKNIKLEQKPFAMGLRVIHKQEFINKAQYGDNYADIYEDLPESPYKLTTRVSDGRGVYSFCMCPGGYVVNASSEKESLCVNGMSNSKRDSRYANSAVIVQVSPEDFGSKSPLAGVELQRKIEKNAYKLCNGLIPVQNFDDFVEDKASDQSDINPDEAILGKWSYTNLSSVFPEFIKIGIIEGMNNFNQIIDNFSTVNPLLCGVESRTSSPIKIVRSELLCSDIVNLYPCGEGAGYAGGIMSAAIDGLKVAEKILEITEA